MIAAALPYRLPGSPGSLDFAPATKDLLASRQLLRRIDSKYIVPLSSVMELLGSVARDYAALHTRAGMWAIYRSLYFDTSDLRCFHDHRRGRRIRHKVRIRHYPDRELSFLEVKTKQNDAFTGKQRLELPYGQESLFERERSFLCEVVGCDLAWVPSARVDYRRLSLIAFAAEERVTIDHALEIAMPNGPSRALGAFTVVEIKQAKRFASPMVQRLVEHGFRERSLSKYVAAIATLHPNEPKNRLLPALRGVAKIAAQ